MKAILLLAGGLLLAFTTSALLAKDDHLGRKLYDASGVHRGEMTGPVWDDFGRTKLILLDSYRPEKLPFPQDWVLVLEARK